MSPINLIDCSLEDLVAALLHKHPIAMPEGGLPFILENDNARTGDGHALQLDPALRHAVGLASMSVEDSQLAVRTRREQRIPGQRPCLARIAIRRLRLLGNHQPGI